MRDQLARVLQVLLGVRVVVFFAVVLVLFAILGLGLILRCQGGLSLLFKLPLLAGDGFRFLGELFLADSQLLLGLGGCLLELGRILTNVSGLRVLLHLNVDLVGLDAVVVVELLADARIGARRHGRVHNRLW